MYEIILQARLKPSLAASVGDYRGVLDQWVGTFQKDLDARKMLTDALGFDPKQDVRFDELPVTAEGGYLFSQRVELGFYTQRELELEDKLLAKQARIDELEGLFKAIVQAGQGT